MVENDMGKIDIEIEKLNKKLGAGFGRITIRRKGMALYARGTFPPKPGTDKKWQGDFALKCRATIPGLRDAQDKALELSSQLARDRFSWIEHTTPEIITTASTTPVYIHEWIDRQKQEYINSRKRITTDTDRNWLKDYGYCYDRLPGSQVLSTDILLKAIESTTVGTKQRSRAVNAYRKLLLLAGIDATPLDQFKTKQSEIVPVQLRQLPTLDTIIEWWHKLPPDLKSEYGFRAAYGLRPGESIEDCDFSNVSIEHEITVYASKTGKRRLVYPYPDRLFDLFDLSNPVPYLSKSESKQQRTSSFRQRLVKFGLPFDLYDLRHQYAYQTILHNVNPRIACKLMGHSLKTHTDVYNLFLDAKEFRELRQNERSRLTGSSSSS